MRARVVHHIEASFKEPARGATFSLRLTPPSAPAQSIEFHQIVIDPAAEREEHDGLWHVRCERGPFQRLSITAITTVRLDAARVAVGDTREARRVLEHAGVDPQRRKPTRDRVSGLCRKLAEDALWRLRQAGRVARYVAGYRLSAGEPRTLPHAWIAFDLPEGGPSIGFDPTTSEFLSERSDVGYLTLAQGQGYADTQPIEGTLLTAGDYCLSSSVSVEVLPTT